jgi:hypothetical protein
VLDRREDAFEHHLAMLADDKVSTQVELLSRSHQLRAGLIEKTITLVEIPLGSPVQKGGAGTVQLHIEVVGVLCVFHFGHIKLYTHIMTSRVGVGLVALYRIMEEKLLGIRVK